MVWCYMVLKRGRLMEVVSLKERREVAEGMVRVLQGKERLRVKVLFGLLRGLHRRLQWMLRVLHHFWQ